MALGPTGELGVSRRIEDTETARDTTFSELQTGLEPQLQRAGGGLTTGRRSGYSVNVADQGPPNVFDSLSSLQGDLPDI
eukprot:scaffold45304_cov191-Amphora_coffeaeformis.AAC.3